MFGKLPNREQLSTFNSLLQNCRELPEFFAEDMILKSPSPSVMNKMQRSVLSFYSYDSNPDDTSTENVLRQSIFLIATLPSVMAYAYQVKRRVYDHASMVLHPPVQGLSTAENILYSLRSDGQFTDEEARLLDICLMLHAEHGGGNCSTFTSRVLSSSGTDTYGAISAAIGALKGPRHGGANIKVQEMLGYMQGEIADPTDETQVKDYLRKMLRGEVGDHSGLIYGMGHAVYTKSDPRAVILKREAEKVAKKSGLLEDYALLSTIERLTPDLMMKERGIDKAMCANVDMYSGLIYRSMGIAEELFTPLFAIARIVGWCAHRVEEVYNTSGRIIRPAYKAISPRQTFVPLSER